MTKGAISQSSDVYHENRTCLTADTACAAMREFVSPAQVRVEARADRWLAWLPGERPAWFPANAMGRERLKRERRVLRLLAERGAFLVPRVLFKSEQGWDVRAGVLGVCDPWALYRRTLPHLPHLQRLKAGLHNPKVPEDG